MDRSALSRSRTRDAPQPVRPSTATSTSTTPKDDRPASQRQATRGRSQPAPDTHFPRPSSGKIRKARDSSEITRAKRGDGVGAPQEEMTAAEDDRESQHFTVGGVGAGGTLYLTPSRLPPSRHSRAPVTPPRPAERVESGGTIWPDGTTAGTSFARASARAKGTAYDHTVPVPPISLANLEMKRRPRSHSFSTLSERERARAPTLDSTDVQDFRFFLNGKRRSQSQRPKSTLNLGEGMLQHHIPHYRLGTPRFSARGTAYLHTSVYTTNTTEDANSSMFSRSEYDKLFPAPPGQSPRGPYTPPARSHEWSQNTPNRTPPSNRMSMLAQSGVRTFVFEKIQANPNDPSIVRFSAQTGKIEAATPARLIAQITSPDFLDYELLSDFFLTYRGFLSPSDLLEYLLARMRWALGDAADSGRIARVRTFVALRHWILNYFHDDFLFNFDLRQRFCDLVNQMCSELSQRSDKGGGDLNILGELKKCWRRTCALFWQSPDAMDTAAQADIQPGGEQEEYRVRASLAGSPSAMQYELIGDSAQAALAPQVAAETGMHSSNHRHSGIAMADSMRSPRPSMQTPGSPMSGLSLQVVSCSAPFFSALRPSANPLRKVLAPRPAGSKMHPPPALGQSRPSHQHKRSGSFSDALRDGRTPLPSAKLEGDQVKELPNLTLTAGLIRGLVVQPSAAQVQVVIPQSPGPQAPEARKTVRTAGIDEQINPRHSQQHLGVKRIVGDMRRVLSTRKTNRSPARSHRSASSSGSKSSNPPHEPMPEEKSKPVITWQLPKGPIRHDLLGASATKAFEEAQRGQDAPRDSQITTRPRVSAHDSVKPEESGFLARPGAERALSQVTASSQSIMIVDATGPQELPVTTRSLPSVSTWSCTMIPAPMLSQSPGQEHIEQQDYFGGNHRQRADDAEATPKDYRDSSEPSLHGLLSLPEQWRTTQSAIPYEYNPSEPRVNARKSSGVQSPAFEMPPIRNPIRRVPGGDLKNVGHVHDLESEPRIQSTATMSTISRSLPNSYDFSGTHLSGQNFPTQVTSLPARTMPKESLGLLETPSQPYIRKSIKEDAWRLAKMYDSSPGGGGVEDALLKLEGRYAGRRASTQGIFDRSARDSGAIDGQSSTRPSFVALSEGQDDIFLGDMDLVSPTTDRQGASIFHDSTTDVFTLSRQDDTSEETGGMYSGDERSDAPVLQDPSRATMFPIPSLASPRPSCDDPDKTPKKAQDDAVRHATNRALNSASDESRPGASAMSFLLNDDESLSEISTELTDSPSGDGLGARSFFFDDPIEEESTGHPSYQPPGTPPTTAGAPTKPSPEEKIAVDSLDDINTQPRETTATPNIFVDRSETPNDEQPLHQGSSLAKADLEQTQPAHLPFIFAYSSSVIAEQLTIIEKDALDEIDWKDLIGLNWHQNPPPVRNWVSYLRSSESDNGIDLVIARFNLVVKWVVSEIVLTRSSNERARAITKFVHIASHCLRLKNYASTYQITLALLSTDLTRLKRTWRLVPAIEKTSLARLERLCQPVKNFAALRAEMEAASLSHGCIPFIGLYTHDLMYNAQKPARINPAPPGAPSAARIGHKGQESLINFERYQTSASIAKGLLRLLESSARYEIKPESECLSRCLWLATLSDDEIAEKSRNLE